MARNKSSDLVRKGTFLIIISIVIKFIGMLYRIPLTNMLGDQGNGIYVLAYQIYSFIIIFSTYGVSEAISRMVSERLARKQYANARIVFRVGLIYALAVGLFIFLGLTFGADFIAGTIYRAPSAAPAVRHLAPAALMVSVACVIRGLFQGVGDVRPSSYADLIDQILHAAFSIIFVYVTIHSVEDALMVVNGHYPVLEEAASQAASGTMFGAMAGLLFVTMVFILFRTRSRIFNAPAGKATENYKMIFKIFLLTVIPMMLAATVANLREMIDTALFNILMPLKGYNEAQISVERGILGGKFVVLTNMPIAALGTFEIMLIPGIAGAIARRDQSAIQTQIETLLKMVLMVSIPAAIGLAILGEPIVHWLFPNASEGGQMFRYGSYIVIFYAISQNCSAILQGLGHMRRPLLNAAFGLCVSTPVLVICILVFDIKAYALVASLMAFSFTIAFLNMRSMIKYSGFKMTFFGLFGPPVLCSLIMGVATWLIYHGVHALIPSNTISILLAIGGSVIVYFLMILNSSWYTREQILELPYGKYLVKFRLRK